MRKSLFAATIFTPIAITAALLAACKGVDNWTLSGSTPASAAPEYELHISGSSTLHDRPQFESTTLDTTTTEEIGDK